MSGCAGCEENNGNNDGSVEVAQSGRLLVSPNGISFGRVIVGTTASKEVLVRNTSSEALRIVELALSPRDGGSIDALSIEGIPQGDFVIEGQGSRILTVTYSPTTTSASAGQLEFITSDPRYGRTSPLIVPVSTLASAPNIEANPSQVRFVRQSTRTSPSFIPVSIINTGEADLILTRKPEYNGGADFRLDLPARAYPITIKPDGLRDITSDPLSYQLDLQVRYKAIGEGTDTGTVLVFSNDLKTANTGEDEGVFEIPVTANADASCILIDSITRNFGQVPVGQRAIDLIKVTNCGTQPLDIEDVTLVDESSDEEYSLDLGSWDLDDDGVIDNNRITIDPEKSDSFELRYTPSGEGTDQARIIIQSNDPVTPQIEIAAIGRGAVGKCPTAFAEGRTEGSGTNRQEFGAAPLDYIILDGSESSDEDGVVPTDSEESWIWEATEYPGDAPPTIRGTDARPNDYSIRRTRLLLAGRYVFTLKVRDAQGFISCNESQVTVLAIPSEKILVELTWTNPEDPDETDELGSDIDLHMVKMGPGNWFSTPYDIFFGNTGGESIGHWNPESPSLDIDDTDGLGPENIQMDDPENCQWYAIGVHYYDQLHGTAYATIRVYINQELVFEKLNTPLQRQNQFWDVARIHWDSGQVLDVDDVLPIQPLGQPPEVTPNMRTSGLCTEAALY